jgi:hypothetical protein
VDLLARKIGLKRDLALLHGRPSIAHFALARSLSFRPENRIPKPYCPGQLEIIVATPNAKHTNISGGYRTRAALNLKNLRCTPALLGRPTQIRRNAIASAAIPANKFIDVPPAKHRKPRRPASRDDTSIRCSFDV